MTLYYGDCPFCESDQTQAIGNSGVYRCVDCGAHFDDGDYDESQSWESNAQHRTRLTNLDHDE